MKTLPHALREQLGPNLETGQSYKRTLCYTSYSTFRLAWASPFIHRSIPFDLRIFLKYLGDVMRSQFFYDEGIKIIKNQ